MCHIVGSGPGDPELLTVKAVRLLKEAEVIIYDDLGTEAAVELHASPASERVCVGKRGGRRSARQADIDDLLVQHCLQGRRVVRLKGGCPSVFSRVGSELRALAAAGVPVELVPGVSSALAAPLLAGFPLTDTAIGRSFVVVSAHNPKEADWESLARGADTLVLLMASSNLPEVVERLLATPLPAETPVAVVHAAGLPEQRVWRAALDGVVQATADAGPLSPSVVVIGRVAALPEQAWQQ
ncbi:hypothetical protein WJX81_001568 [Elliptochloris bilobata]|uniref:uroporphyrinogen-III C-methyltransferase n=1 Tax=Elliptochloris bilobata TaxID=381761 RepID=A0AAW1SIB3_9CHLO